MNFYDLDEWELYDLETDPKEMVNQYANPEYTEVVKRMHRELADLRKQYDVPINVKQDLENVDRHYHSAEQRTAAEKKKAADSAAQNTPLNQ